MFLNMTEYYTVNSNLRTALARLISIVQLAHFGKITLYLKAIRQHPITALKRTNKIHNSSKLFVKIRRTAFTINKMES